MIDEIISESCKDLLCKDLPSIFQDLIRNKELEMYSAEINKEITERSIGDEKDIKIIELVTLNHRIPSEYNFLKDNQTGIIYNIHTYSHSSSSDFEPVEHISYNWDILRLGKKPNLKKIIKICDELFIPKNMIRGRLDYGWNEDKYFENGNHISSKYTGNFRIKGQKDNLFKKIYTYTHTSS